MIEGDSKQQHNRTVMAFEWLLGVEVQSRLFDPESPYSNTDIPRFPLEYISDLPAFRRRYDATEHTNSALLAFCEMIRFVEGAIAHIESPLGSDIYLNQFIAKHRIIGMFPEIRNLVFTWIRTEVCKK